jgi:HAD superfamily hydrolase (TIGR01509 family)
MTTIDSTVGAQRPMPLRGVLLDVDGTLLDSNDAHAEAWVRALRDAGRDVAFAHARRLIGMGGDKVLPELSGLDEDSAEGKRIEKRRKAIFQRELLPTLRPFRETRALVERMRADGLTLVVASSSDRETLEGLLEQAGVRDLVDEITSSSDVDASKPDPDVLHAAIRNSGHPADALVMLGDTPYDVLAAERAGVQVIALRCGGWHERELAGAAEIYDDPADLLASYDRSLLGQAAALR